MEISLEDIKAFSGILEDNKVKFLHRLHIENWQQMTIRFFDPDFHLIEVGESMKTLVTRLKQEGNSSDEISKLTLLNIEFVKSLLK